MDPRIDDLAIDAETVYVVPGSHAVSGRSGDILVEQRTEVLAGAAVSVLLAPPFTAIAVVAVPPAAPALARIAVPPVRHGWPPSVVIVEGGITVAMAGVTFWSAVDTLGTLQDFEARPNRAALDDGRSSERRTNVLVGVSIGLGVITALTAAFLVDWKKSSTLRVGVAPGGLGGVF